MNDILTISYEEFPEENIKVLTVSRGDEAIHMLHDEVAEFMYKALIGASLSELAAVVNRQIVKEK